MFAVLVGIGKYEGSPPLNSAVDDARKIATFLTTKLGIPRENITSLYDSDATKQGIIEALSSLPHRSNFKRNDAILFFFSGYAGQAKLKSEGSDKEVTVGIICPADIHKQSGIADAALIQLFDQISKSCGNNITVFLDCASDIFTWGYPYSFVVVAPDRAAETEEGGTFTKSLLKVMDLERDRIDSLTVQSLADRIQDDMSDSQVNIHCYGQNVDRIVFNPAAGEAYHAFISGHTLKDGSIALAAGFAHGVQARAVYGIYASNVIGDRNRVLGYLVVASVNDDNNSTLRLPVGSEPFHCPTIFYAVESHCPHQTVNIFFPDHSPHITTICSIPNSKRVESIEDANITLNFDKDTVSFSWNGVTNDNERMRKTTRRRDPSLLLMKREEKRILRMVKNAARLTYHLTRSSPDNSLVSRGLTAELREVDAVTGEPTGKDLLDDGFAELKLAVKETRGPFCLILKNENNFPVWPFIFVCEPDGFDIYPWYIPKSGAKDAPLRPNDKLVVGCENEEGLLFNWSEGHTIDISYVKIFATMERTVFSSLIQQYVSPAEDTLRDAFETWALEHHKTTHINDGIGEPQSPSIDAPEYSPERPGRDTRSRAKVGLRAKWAAMRITIVQKYDIGKAENS